MVQINVQKQSKFIELSKVNKINIKISKVADSQSIHLKF